MTDNSFTGVFDNEVHYPLNKITYESNVFHMFDLTKYSGVITGNKAWKLKYNLEKWRESGAESILTFGGAYSNHIYQTAKLGHHLGISTIGMIRGEIGDEENRTLHDAGNWGMKLISVDRTTYRKRNQTEYLEALKSKYDCYVVPEGGTNQAAILGTTELGQKIDRLSKEGGIQNIAVAVGTGGTMAGIVNGTTSQNVLGYGALKGNFLQKDVAQWIDHASSSWSIEDDRIFGGYGKWNNELIEFIKSFYEQTSIILDPIYTGKMMYAAYRQDRLNEDWLYIHTGGTQGNRGFNQRFKLDLPTS